MSSVLTMGAVPFGQAAPSFSTPRFTSRVYPAYCSSDGRGGLLWSFDNYFPSGFSGANGVRVGGLVRTTVDGGVDANFAVGPALIDTMGIAMQADGKILVGGRLAGDLALNGAPNFRVFRYLTNGVLDVGYRSPVFGGSPRFMTVQPDGKLLAAWTDTADAVEANEGISGIARLNTDGSLDRTFTSPVLKGNYGVFAPPVLDTNGMIYLAGGFTSVNGESRQGVVRLYPNGALDYGFVPSGFTFSVFVRGVLLQPGGKVVIAGRLRLGGTSSTYYPLIRLNSDGSFDGSFTLVPSSSISFYRARLLAEASGGKMLTVSHSMARFNSDGSLDNSFTRLPFGDAAGDSTGPLGECYWFNPLGDGSIVIPSDPRQRVGPATINGQPFNGSVRLLADGTLDTSYSPPIFQGDHFPTSFVEETDGKLLVAGDFDHVGSTAQSHLVRLNSNGIPDENYNYANTNVLSVLSLVATADNRAYALLQEGDLDYFSTSNVLVRLQTSGAVDGGFNPDLSAFTDQQHQFTDLLLQGGLPVVAPSLTAQEMIDHANLPVVRLLPDGRQDSGFRVNISVPGSGTFADGSLIKDWRLVFIANIGQLFIGDFQMLAPSADARLLAAIGTTTDGATYTYELIRLTSNGDVDTAFGGVSVGPAQSWSDYPMVQDRTGGIGQVSATYPVRCITAAIVQTNGAILVGGNFTSVNGVSRPGVARLSPAGGLDNSFPIGTGPSTGLGVAPSVMISGISSDSAGKVWVTGNFTQWDGVNAPGYVRLNLDGSVDTSCVVESSHYPLEAGFTQVFPVFNGARPGTEGDCFVFGPHLLPGDSWPRALSRLTDYAQPALQSRGMLSGFGFSMSLDTLVGQAYRLQISPDLKTWQDWYYFRGTGGPMWVSDPASLNKPQQFYRATFQQ